MPIPKKKGPKFIPDAISNVVSKGATKAVETFEKGRQVMEKQKQEGKVSEFIFPAELGLPGGAGLPTTKGIIGAKTALGKAPSSIAHDLGLPVKKISDAMRSANIPGNIAGAGKFEAGAGAFSQNAKTVSLTKQFLLGAGVATGIIGIVGTIVGSYPFAKFEVAEATDKIGIALMKAYDDGDLEEAKNLLTEMDTLVNQDWDPVLEKIPFANIYSAASKNIAAANRTAQTYKRLIERQEAGEGKFQKIAAGQVEKAEADREDSAYFEYKRLMKTAGGGAEARAIEELAKSSNLWVGAK